MQTGWYDRKVPEETMATDEAAFSRLDEAKLGGEHWRIYSIAMLGHICDGFNIEVMAIILPSLFVAFHLNGASAGFLASATFFGMFVGATAGGMLADTIGRKTTMVVALAIFGVIGLLSAWAPTYWTLWVARLLAGVGLGAEVVLVFSYLVEFLPVRNRGLLAASSVFIWQLSTLIVAVIGIAVIPAWGWRGMLIICAAPAVIFAAAWLTLPESVRFLVQKGRFADAERIAQKFKGGSAGVSVAASTEVAPPRTSIRQNVSLILRREYRVQTIGSWVMLFVQGFEFFGIVIWLPTLFLRMGFPFVHDLLFTAAITGAGAVANIVAGVLLEQWGRRPTIILYFAASGLALIGWGFTTSATAVVLVGMVAAFFSFGTFGPLFVWINEVYPTKLRATASGFAGSWQRVGGFVAPIVLGLLVEAKAPNTAIFGLVGVLMLIGAIMAVISVKETRKQTLENIQASVMRAG